MAVLEIRHAGDKILKDICRPVRKIDRNVRELLNDMADTMYELNGVGLAAPQVGASLRVVVIDIGEGLIELVNPRIVDYAGEKVTDSEGCLSVPDIYGDVERYSKVTVEAQNRYGKNIRLTGEGLLSVAIQHELDHLDGILFIDKAKTLQRGKA